MTFCKVFALLVLLISLPYTASGDESSHEYNDMEPIVFWADKIWPENNPFETYLYGTLPLCELDVDTSRMNKPGSDTKYLWLGELLEGHGLRKSTKIKANFGVPAETTEICSSVLSGEAAAELQRVIRMNFHYLYYVDDLPVHGDFGFIQTEAVPGGGMTEELLFFTHRTFAFARNGKNIISVDVLPSEPVAITEGVQLTLTYSVQWEETQTQFNERFERFLEESFFEHHVHWLSIINSFVLCIFLCAVVVIILSRTLKNDFARYAASEASELESLDASEDSGWKQVHGDVFRRPHRLLVFSTIVGTGCHIAATGFVVGLLALFNSYYSKRGMTTTALLLTFVALQFVNGIAGGFTFRLYGGKGWRKAMLGQLLAMPLLALLLFGCTWIVASSYNSSIAVPLPRVLLFVLLLIFVCMPLQLIGTRWGRFIAGRVSFPCRVHQLKRPLPPKPRSFFPLTVSTAGLVPFGCVFVETYFLFQSIWSHNKFYFVYGFLLVILLLYSCILVCVSITCTYVLLNAEDYRWAWLSVTCSAASAVYVFLYSVHYYATSSMDGLLQSVQFFCSSIFMCAGLGLFSSAIGFFGALRFVLLIYRNVKSD
eukprot:Lankesteria_metandrocarpae@DN3458_c0_g1_i1.p1